MAFAPAGPPPDSPALRHATSRRFPADLQRYCRRRSSRAGRYGFARLVAARLVIPGGLVVGLSLGVEARIQAVVRQLEAVFDEERRVGVVDEILVGDAIVLERVVDDAAEESDVATGTNLQEQVGLRRPCG